MQLFLDIDGVLLNFEHAFVRWLNDRFRLGLPADYEAASWDFEEVLTPEMLRDGWHDFLDSQIAAELPPLVEPERFNRLGAAHSLHLLTNFPQPHMEKRLANLQAHGFAYHTLHYCGLHAYKELRPLTKAQVIQSLRDARGEGLFVDDHPDNCVDVQRNCPDVEVWLMSRRFNRDFAHPAIRRARGWEDLFARIGGAARSAANGAAPAAQDAAPPPRPGPFSAAGK
jgi:FMN phosphatase YigB (HAD superfamily)